MSSQRLPGKVLREVSGKPLLSYTLERMARCQSVDEILVATSDQLSDDSVARFCELYGVACYRGSLDDVAGRFVRAAMQYHLDVFVRVNGDSPLLDQQLIDHGVTVFCNGDFDLVTNVFPRTYPKGFSVEVIGVSALRRAYSAMMDEADHEHVTRYFYQHPESFCIQNFSFHQNCSNQQLSIDTVKDLKLFEAMVAAMTKPHWQYGIEEALTLADSVSESVK
jgi:spore coat polysaccharide biosynthesis protein SpsF